MATTRRDIELLISARETTGRSFKQVTDNIDALNRKIGEQIAQAERGEISLQDLRQTQEQLASAGRDLSAIQGQIDAYNRLVATSDKVGAAAEKAKADLAALQATVEGAGKATAAQENRMQRLENAVTRTSAAVDKNKQDLAEQITVLQRAGVAVDNLDQAQAGIVNTARQIGAGMSQVNTAIDGYAANVNRARQAESDLAAQQGFERKIAEAQRLGQASRFVQLFGDAINTVKTADNQMSALTGFRAIGQQAAEASRDISRFVQEGQSVAVTSQQVAAGLRAILDPGGAALQTLAGVEEAIEKADQQAADGVKNVGLLNDAYNNLAASASALLRQGSLVDTFQQQAAATATARQQFEAAQADVQKLGQAMAAADEPTEQLASALAKAEANLEKTGRALTQEETKLGQLSRELKAAEINTENLAAEQARLEAAAGRVGATMERVNTTLGRGGRATNGLFGLKPNDLANLSYQINDIFVSLASGQNPMMVLVQQGSQIGQIFPGLISTVARFALAWAPVIAVVAAVGAAFYELYTDAERLKKASQDLAAAPLGEGIDVQRFADAQEKLEGVAEKAEEARTAMLLLVEEGFDTDSIERYSEAAADLSKRLGIDVVEATQMLVDIQKGGIEAVYDLAEKTNDLTAADLDHAEALYEAGRAGEARQFVLDRVAERNQQIADATQSSWTPAVNNLKSAWESFTGWLGRVFAPVLDGINDMINDTIVGFTFLTGLLAGKGIAGAREDAFDVIRQQRGLNQPPARGASDQNIRDRRYSAQLDEQELQNRKAITNEQRLQIAAQKARNDAQAAGVSSAVEERAVQQAMALEQRKISEEAERAGKKGAAAGRRAEAAAARAQRAAEAEQRKRESALRSLDGQLRQLNRQAFAGISASLEERLQAISEKYETIADSIKKVRDLGMTTDSEGVSLDVIEQQVAATQQRLKDEETIKFYQEQAALLEKQREAEIQRITDARIRGALTTQQAMEQAAEVTGRISPQIVRAAESALTVARALAGANPSPEMVSWIASLERIISGEQSDRSVADVGLAGLDDASKKLDTLLKERDDLVKSYQTLNELGLQSDAETRELTAQAYARQAEAIQPVLVSLREQVELLHNTRDALTGLPVLSDTAYATWLAKLDALNAGLANTDSRIAQVNQAAMQGIQTGVTNAFNSAANAIVGLINGTQSWGDTLEGVFTTALQFAADFLNAIAQVLIQMVALQVAKSIIGGSTGGFGSLFFHDGGIVGKQGGSYKRVTGGGDSWIGAPKFHGGGGLGLRPDEYKAVLKRGEEVLTEDDPRHVNNLGSGDGGGSQPALKQVLFLDPDQVVGAMQGRAGQKTFLTFIRTNKETIKQVLG